MRLQPSFFLIVPLFLALFSCHTNSGSQPRAQRGVLDLREWNWERGPVDLDGEWLFSPGTYLAPQQEGQDGVLVPSGLLFREGHVASEGSPFGFGTYTLKILLPPGNPTLGLRLPLIGTAFELYADGTRIDSLGKLGTSAQTTTPYYQPRIAVLTGGSNQEVFLSLRVANFQDLFTGIYYSIRFGPAPEMYGEREAAALWEATLFGAIFLMGVYHFGFFFFRRKYRAPFWFALFCLFLSIRSTLYGETIFLSSFPWASWDFVLRSVYLTMSLAIIAFVFFVQALYPKYAWKPATWITGGVVGAFGLLNIAAPIPFFTTLLVPIQFFIVLAGAYSLFVVTKALWKKESGASLFAIGTAVFLLTIGYDIFKNHFFFVIPSLVNWGLLFFLLMQALVVTRQFSKAYSLVEDYSFSLETLNHSLERFIPKEVLGFLNKKSIVDIDLGDYSEMQMTVFFLDIRDFTTLSESMTPKENFRFINSFLKRFGPVIRNNGGFVDKYLGDGLMALFPGSADEAVRAALQMRKNLIQYNEGRERGGYAPIRFGVGVHTGPLMLGTIGENMRMDSTVISDTVNAASRLEGLTKKYTVDILLSGATIEKLQVPEDFNVHFVAMEFVKGKSKPIEVFQVHEKV